MLPKNKRIPRNEVFQDWGRSLRTPVFILKARKNDRTQNRYAIRVGKNVSKSAVSRNRVRRRLAGPLSLWNDIGADVLIIALPVALDASSRDIQSAFLRAKSFLYQSH